MKVPCWTPSDNCVLVPTKETCAFYLHEYNEKISMRYQYELSESGKWLLYYHTNSLDLMWAKACWFYRNHELEGIKYMKVSTSRYNPRHYIPDMGVIMFFCGPSSKKKLMRAYARGILKKMLEIGPYHQGHIQYEIDHCNELFMRVPRDNLNCIYNYEIPKKHSQQKCRLAK